MTLDPVFRSREAVRQIKEDGFLDRMDESLAAHRETLAYVHGLMPEIIDRRFLSPAPPEEGVSLELLQNHFFLILFHSIFKSLGTSAERLRFYARLNLCIKGTVTAGDNLFDDEGKSLLPLELGGAGHRFGSILQLLCFDRLSARVYRAAIGEGWLTRTAADAMDKGLLNRLAAIGTLEGQEERGVDEVLTVDDMIARVHRVRGGSLFSLAFIAPEVIETGALRERFVAAERAISDLGTAFQIVDDLTDFEFDLTRRSHNILTAAAYHSDDERVRAAIRDLLKGKRPEPNLVETVFARPAKAVLDRARGLGRSAFEQLQALGFWFPPERSDTLIHSIVGIEGVARMESLTS